MKASNNSYSPGFITAAGIRPDVERELRRIADVLKGLQAQIETLQKQVATIAQVIIENTVEVH